MKTIEHLNVLRQINNHGRIMNMIMHLNIEEIHINDNLRIYTFNSMEHIPRKYHHMNLW